MSQTTFTDLCAGELELCGIGEGSTIAVLSQGNRKLDYVDAFLAAADRLGATGFNVRLPAVDSSLDGEEGMWEVGETPLAGNRPAIEALKGVDLVVDTVFLLFSPEQMEIQESGTRVLLCIEPIEHIEAMQPSPRLRERVEAGAEILGKAKTLRFTNEAGTDVTYRLGSYPVMTQYGYTDTPGRWDHWPSGFLFTGGADDGVDGKVVIAPGDIIFPFKSYVQTPIELTIERGKITAVEGGVDADLLREYMASFEDPDAYGISHIGWGMLETAQWSILAHDRRGMGMHGRSFYGNVLFSTGPNGELGGPNQTLCHVDVPMRNCSLYLDDEPIVVDGEIVVDVLKADRLVGV
ncbi:MAG: leucyl aminopeptidase [Actinobacteria bacterium]|nr:leucyl aminopeptidase [Actinomycetota bacterium]